jgi:hypothetical protein
MFVKQSFTSFKAKKYRNDNAYNLWYELLKFE